MGRGLLAAIAAASLLAIGSARAELVINVSKSQQRIAVIVDGSEAYRWPVSTGRRGYATPSGVFHPERLERHWYSHAYENSPMPWAVFFHRGYAVHGTMEAYHLGRAASHGCVRLRPDHARTLFGLVKRVGSRNTRIVVLNGPLPRIKPLPSNVPMAAAKPDEAREKFAKALANVEVARPQAVAEHLSARTHPASVMASVARQQPHDRVSQSSDEARVLREREAWLRGLDRKYGIVR